MCGVIVQELKNCRVRSFGAMDEELDALPSYFIIFTNDGSVDLPERLVRARGVVQPTREPRKKRPGSTLAQPTAQGLFKDHM